MEVSSSSVRTTRRGDGRAGRDDAQLLINLLGTFSGLRELRMAVGPLFAPEHLEELLDEPRWKRSIEGLSFRFNPYVSERSYYTFLKVRSSVPRVQT